MEGQGGPKGPTGKRSLVGLVVAYATAAVVLLVIVALVLVPVLTGGREANPADGYPDTPGASPTTPAPRPTVAPTPSRLTAPLTVRVLFAHQSIGQDIVRGVPEVFKSARLKAPQVQLWSRARNSRGPVLATATIGQNGDPRSKLRAFASLVNNAPRNSVDVALMAFNYQDISADTDVEGVFQIYTETMDSLETANPDISFLYATVPVTTANSWRSVDQSKVQGLVDVSQPVWQDNIARERFNSLLRQEYRATGRLFDVAALQARLGGTKVSAKEHEGQWYFVMNPGLSTDGRRLNTNGSRQLARALMLFVEASKG